MASSLGIIAHAVSFFVSALQLLPTCKPAQPGFIASARYPFCNLGLIFASETAIRNLSHCGEKLSGLTDVLRGVTAFDRGKHRLEQRTDVVVGSAVAPEPGEIVRRAQFQQAALLAARSVDRLSEAGLCQHPIRSLPAQRELAAEAMQLRQPEAFAGLLDEGETLGEIPFSFREFAGLERHLREVGHDHRTAGEAAGLPYLIERGAHPDDGSRFGRAHGTGVGAMHARKQPDLLGALLRTISDQLAT